MYCYSCYISIPVLILFMKKLLTSPVALVTSCIVVLMVHMVKGRLCTHRRWRLNPSQRWSLRLTRPRQGQVSMFQSQEMNSTAQHTHTHTSHLGARYRALRGAHINTCAMVFFFYNNSVSGVGDSHARSIKISHLVGGVWLGTRSRYTIN